MLYGDFDYILTLFRAKTEEMTFSYSDHFERARRRINQYGETV